MKPSSQYDEKDQKIIKLLEDLRSFESEYPSGLLTARRAEFLAQLAQLAQMEQLGQVETGEELSAGDQETVKLLERLKSVQVPYPTGLLAARRAAFIAQVEQLSAAEAAEELPAGAQEVLRLLGNLKAVPLEYPPELLDARRSAFLRLAAEAGRTSLLERLQRSLKRIFWEPATSPASPARGVGRLSLVLASLLLAVFIGSFLFSRTELSSSSAPSQTSAAPTLLPPGSGETALTICAPGDRTPACSPDDLTPGRDLANVENGAARPAVSRDGREGDSWVSQSPGGWIKIDLGQVTNVNTIRLQKGSPGFASENDLGQFVIAVALSDVYSDGNSSDDFREYAQVFASDETGFSGTVSTGDTILTRFPPTRARYIKITFEQAGAAIREVGVFNIPPAGQVEQATSTPAELPAMTFTSTLTPTGTLLSFASPLPSGTSVLPPANTLPPSATNAPPVLSTDTGLPFQTPAVSSTARPADTLTPLPTDLLPTIAPPTAIPPTVQPAPAGGDPIVVTGSGQTLTLTCSGNEADIRGHANIVTLQGACISITVTGNENLVFYESGSPVIVDRGRDNVISLR